MTCKILDSSVNEEVLILIRCLLQTLYVNIF